MEDTVLAGHSGSRGFFDRFRVDILVLLVSWPHLDSLLKLHMERKANYGYHLWGMLMLFLWIKQWKIQCPQDIQALEDFSTVSA